MQLELNEHYGAVMVLGPIRMTALAPFVIAVSAGGENKKSSQSAVHVFV